MEGSGRYKWYAASHALTHEIGQEDRSANNCFSVETQTFCMQCDLPCYS